MDSVAMLADPFPQSSYTPPKKLSGISVGVFVYIEDVDAVVQQAVDAGATVTMPVQDMFWGDRFGQVTAPFGHGWQIATHKEDAPPDEMAERTKEAMASMS